MDDQAPSYISGSAGSDSSLNQFDQNLVNQCSFYNLVGGFKIFFQFPPRILSESNDSRWEEGETRSIEPIRIHTGSGGRKLAMEWDYIATDSTWNAQRIGDMLRALKSYFFLFTVTSNSSGFLGFGGGTNLNGGSYPTVQVRYAQVVPVDTQFRLLNLHIDYSPEIIQNPTGFFHPLYTKVHTDLEMATTINDISGTQKMPVSPLSNATWDWY